MRGRLYRRLIASSSCVSPTPRPWRPRGCAGGSRPPCGRSPSAPPGSSPPGPCGWPRGAPRDRGWRWPCGRPPAVARLRPRPSSGGLAPLSGPGRRALQGGLLRPSGPFVAAAFSAASPRASGLLVAAAFRAASLRFAWPRPCPSPLPLCSASLRLSPSSTRASHGRRASASSRRSLRRGQPRLAPLQLALHGLATRLQEKRLRELPAWRLFQSVHETDPIAEPVGVGQRLRLPPHAAVENPQDVLVQEKLAFGAQRLAPLRRSQKMGALPLI